MTIGFDEWVANSEGKKIGAGQCWDLANDYLVQVLGGTNLSTQGGTHPGYAIGSYTGYANNGLGSYFKREPSNASAPAGSLVFWDWGTNFPDFQAPDSHVAVVLQDLGDHVKVLSQNSPQQSAQVQVMPKEGIAGYLVPNNLPTITPAGQITPAPPQIENVPQSVFQSVLASLGLDKVFTPGSPASTGLQNFLTNIFIPGMWTRVVAGLLGIILIFLGIVFIIKSHPKDEPNG